jgi:hypothetical protein
MHGILDALVEPTSQFVEDVDASTERVQASRVGAAPDRRDVDHGELPRPEIVQRLTYKHANSGEILGLNYVYSYYITVIRF